MGAGDLDHQQFAQLCDLCCGGLSASPHIAVQCDDSALFKQDMLFTSHCVERNLQEMLSLWQKVLTRFGALIYVHYLIHIPGLYLQVFGPCNEYFAIVTAISGD